jgi:hypothetical protein
MSAHLKSSKAMQHTNWKFILAYLLLVALPLVLLTGILRSGRTLAAPVSVGGMWKIQTTSDKVVLLFCGQSISADTNFAILQSGKYFTLKFANSTMPSISGVVEGSAIKARIVPPPEWAKVAGCNEGRSLALNATVDSKVGARFLSGTLLLSDCSACIPLQFQAVREDQGKSKKNN